MRLLIHIFLIISITSSITSCAALSYLTEMFGDSGDNNGTNVETTVDAQFGGERQSKLSGTDNKTEIDTIKANTAKTEVNNGNRQSFDNAKKNEVTNEIGITYWFWMAIIGWLFAILGWFMPAPSQIIRWIKK